MPTLVAFTSAISGNPTSIAWDFGDGTTSTQANPVHTYSSPGIYAVRLTASKGGVSSVAIKTIPVTGLNTLTNGALTNNAGSELVNNESQMLVVSLGG